MKTFNQKLVVAILIILGTGFTGTFALEKFFQNSADLATTPKFWVGTEVVSSDPLDFDISSHHVAFRPVLAGLVSLYKKGEILGVLADRWSTNEAMTRWEFHIRPNMKFQNGDAITAEVVASSLKRMAHILKVRGSKSGLFEHCIGFDTLDSPSSQWDGLAVKDDAIIFTLTKPMPKFLETISFGLYSIAHPSDYDHITGAWINAKKVIASGPYTIKNWSENSLMLELRKDFPTELRHPKASKLWEITWQEGEDQIADIVSGDSETAPSRDHIFIRGIYSSIEYLTCTSWSHPQSICHSSDNRKILRAKFAKGMAAAGLPTSSSFLPPLSPGVHEIKEDFAIYSDRKFDKTYPPIRFRKKSPLLNSPYKKYREVFTSISHELNSEIEWVDVDRAAYQRNKEANLQRYDYDFSIQGSEIDIEDPRETLRFMFLSKEGIRLPDATGDIIEALKEPNFSLQTINELIWKQAIIWPILHHAHSIWVKKERFNFSLLNTETAATDISWIGQRA